MINISKKWYDFAEEDYRVIKTLWSGNIPTYRVICFHSQQFVEKILKGVLEQTNINPPRIHDIIKLTKLCLKNNIEIPLTKEEQIFLSSVYIDSRYPPDAGLIPDGEPQRSDADMAVRIVSKIYDWVNT